jgi:predicted GNAT family acetyltransferase
VPGVPRAVTAAEIDLLERWHREFVAEAGLPAAPERAALLARIADGAAWWWVHDGQRVSLAGHAPVVPAGRSVVGRIGPVYTPVPFRRRGFGAAVTAHVATLLQQRCTDVVLFADDANPTSNGVYRRLGFEPAAQWVEVPTR